MYFRPAVKQSKAKMVVKHPPAALSVSSPTSYQTTKMFINGEVSTSESTTACSSKSR